MDIRSILISHPLFLFRRASRTAKTEDEDELEDDYDFGTKGEPPTRFDPGLARRNFFQQRQQSWIPTNRLWSSDVNLRIIGVLGI